MKFETFTVCVLAGAYSEKLQASKPKAMLTHLLIVRQHDNEWISGCRQPADRLADPLSTDTPDDKPTCPTCARLWERFNA